MVTTSSKSALGYHPQKLKLDERIPKSGEVSQVQHSLPSRNAIADHHYRTEYPTVHEPPLTVFRMQLERIQLALF